MSSPFIGFHHIALIVSNYEVSKHFYVNILGAKIIAETYREDRDSYKLDLRFADHSQIELFSFPTPPTRVTNPEACGLRHLAFKVENIDATIEYLKQHQVVCEPVRIDKLTGKQFTFFKDPDGLPLELYQWNTENTP
ncbi:VOC family protein [Gallibacterium trehalosifermentans]|uniref:VOC family protein n=1 Tax=Gallibacterium trehalosifermentans TaxID=516935 RepID=A0ABV6H0U5_9PAST